MTEIQLGQESRALIDSTRDAYEPTASNRARVRWRVERTLSKRPVPVLGLRWRRALIPVGAVAGMLVGVGVAAAWVWQSAAPEPVAPQAAPQPVTQSSPAGPRPRTQPELAPEPEPAAAQPAKPNVTPKPQNPRRKSSSLGRASGNLAAETSLIARAQAATNRGQPDRALELLRAYDRKYRAGALAQERSVARVLALCAAGRHAAARAEGRRFLARWPRSPQAARIQQSPCRPGTVSAAED